MTRMMKVGMVVTLLLMGQVGVWAGDCPPGTTLQVKGTVQTAGTNATTISTTGGLIRASRVSCGSTACVATLYDSDGSADPTDVVVDAEVKDEPGAAASTSTWTTYDPPLAFSDGISFHDDSNVNAILVYECR